MSNISRMADDFSVSCERNGRCPAKADMTDARVQRSYFCQIFAKRSMFTAKTSMDNCFSVCLFMSVSIV